MIPSRRPLLGIAELSRQSFRGWLSSEELPQPGHRGPADDERFGRIGKLQRGTVALEPTDRAERFEIDDQRPADAGESPRRKLLAEIPEEALHEQRARARPMDQRIVLSGLGIMPAGEHRRQGVEQEVGLELGLEPVKLAGRKGRLRFGRPQIQSLHPLPLGADREQEHSE